jgi:lipase chaperone LimK
MEELLYEKVEGQYYAAREQIKNNTTISESERKEKLAQLEEIGKELIIN